jgi:hypothetical protein
MPAWEAFADDVMRQAYLLESLGIEVWIDDVDPYLGPAAAAELFDDVRLNRRVRVLGTHVTGSHPVLSDDVNDAFRAVHDVFGHYVAGRGFDRHGEEAAYRQHVRMFASPLARLAMTTETRGQNAALIYSADGATFARQKVAILPASFTTPDALAPTRAELPAAVRQARRFHREAGLGNL